MIGEKIYKHVRIVQMEDSKTIFRLITDPLTADEVGRVVVLLVREPAVNNFMAKGLLLDVGKVVSIVQNDGMIMNFKPEDIMGWSTPSLLELDVNNRMLQEHPEYFSKPGSFVEDGKREAMK